METAASGTQSNQNTPLQECQREVEALRTALAVAREQASIAQARSQELERINAELQQTLDRLAESEERYRTLFELSSEGIMRWEFEQPISIALPIDEQNELYYRFMYMAEVNAACAAMYGYENPEDLVGLKLSDVHSADLEKNKAMNRAHIENGHRIRNAQTDEFDHSNGQRRYFLNNTASTIKDGYVVGAWSTQVDITELRETQQALLQAEQARSQELAKANEELRQRDCLLSSVAAVSKDLLESAEIDNAISQALQQIGEAAGISRITLMRERREAGSERLQHQVIQEWAAPNISRQMDDPVTRVVYNDEYGVLVDKLHAGQSIWHTLADFPEPARTQQAGIEVKSTGAVPIFIEGEYFGCVGFDDCITYRQWIAHEIDVLTSGAGAIGAALHRQQLVDRLIAERVQAEQERSAELAKANEALKRSLDSLASELSLDKFLGQVLTAIAEQFDSPLAKYWYHPEDTAYIGMMSWQKQVYNRDQIAQLYPEHPGIIGTPIPQDMQIEPLLQRKQPLIRDNSAIPLYKEHADRYALGLYQELNLPMILGETNIGTLAIRLPKDRQIKPQQVELAQALAHQATLAVQLTRLAEEAKQAAIAREQEKAAQERAAELAKANEALRRGVERLAEVGNIDALLDSFLLEAMTVTGASAGAVFDRVAGTEFQMRSLAQDGRLINPVETEAFGNTLRAVSARDPVGVFHQLIEAQVYCHDVDDNYAAWFPEAAAFHCQQGNQVTWNFPFRVAGEVVGFLGLAFREYRLPNQVVSETVQALGHQVSLALETLRLAEEAKQAAILEERNRMARDIHDSLAQSFTGIIMQLEAVKNNALTASDEIELRLDRISDLARLGLSEARRSVQALRPQALEAANFAAALRHLLHQMTHNTPIRATLAVEGTPLLLPPTIEENLLRIAQEALTNAIRHGHAHTLTLQLLFEPAAFHLQISDDGNGFDPHAITSAGFGLVGMQERILHLNGHFHLVSRPGAGTEITVTVPVGA